MMSNHYHLVLTDPYGTRPAFFQLLNSLVARALNAHMGRWESFWAPGSYQAPRLLDVDTVLRKCVYTLNNPIEAGLVRYAWDFGSASSWGVEYNRPMHVKRPEAFFSEELPETLSLVLHRPAGLFPELDDREARAHVRQMAQAKQRELVRGMQDRGVTFMGMRRVLKQPRHSAPQTRAARRGIHPTVAGPSKWARMEALQQDKAFRQAYAEARALLVSGHRDVMFPAGTYLMHVRLGMPIAA